MRLHWINWIAALGCLASGIAFTVAGKPMEKTMVLVLLGIANVGFIFLRNSRSRRN